MPDELNKAPEVVKDKTAAEVFIERRNNLLKELGLEKSTTLHFPMYNVWPVDLKLAVEIVNKHNPAYISTFSSIEKEVPNEN